MEDLKKENEYLREQFYGQQVNRRQAIVQDLIRRGVPNAANEIIEEADKLCSFIESRSTTVVGTKLGKRLVKAVKEGRAAVKKKRKYQKKSLFWKKKGK